MELFGLILLGLATGIISGMGIGGGTLLIPGLTLLFGVGQQQAQMSNLLIFLPTALLALIIHIRKKRVQYVYLLWMGIPGLFGAAAGALLFHNLRGDVLRRGYAVLLLGIGIYELLRKSPESSKAQ